MELRCQIRFADAPAGARAVLEACDSERNVVVTIQATGRDRGEAIAALAERTRDLYSGICGVVETVEDVARTYLDVSA